MKILSFLFMAIYCLLSNASEIDYFINFGFDFSTGMYVQSKVVDKKGVEKTLWTRHALDSSVFYNDTYMGLPEREKRLQVSCNPDLFRNDEKKNLTDTSILNWDDLFDEFQIHVDSVTFKLKENGVRFLISRQNEILKPEYGQCFTLKQGEALALTDGRHLSLNLAFLPKERLNEDQQWLCHKATFPGQNVLAVTEYFNSKSFGRDQIGIRDFLILPDWEKLELTAIRVIFLNLYRNKTGKYVILSANHPASVLKYRPMNSNNYEDVLLRLKDFLKKTIDSTVPFPPPKKENPYGIMPVFSLSDRPDEKTFMKHYFEVKDVFSIEVAPTAGFRFDTAIHINGVADRKMFIYTKFNPKITPELKSKIKQILTPEVLLIPQKAVQYDKEIM